MNVENKVEEEIVRAICGMYEIDSEEALKKMEEKRGRKIPLPYCGKVNEKSCMGIRVNHSLYTQCKKKPCKETEFCKTCKLSNSDIRKRDHYIRDKAVANYGNVLKKLDISPEQAIREANSFGLTIPENQLKCVQRKRGRKSKKQLISVSDTDDEEHVKPKKRGRPKKNKTVININNDYNNDLILSLLNKATQNKNISSNTTPTDDESDDDSHEISVEEYEQYGITYFRDKDNNIYDFDTYEVIGVFNVLSSSIDFS
tara:strand:+ start:97 stop:867 length:771 start_codon:yes stop_codon:yes gene_type:complete